MWNFLEWKNRFEGELTQNLVLVGDYNPIEFPDQDTEIQLVLSISLAQFTKLYSSIVKGAILSYPDEYEQVAWSFLKAFEMPYDICQIIADCIDNPDSPTRQAIRNFVTGDTVINQHIQNISRGGLPMPEIELPMPIVSGCDPDETWAGIGGLVDQMHANNIDFLELFELDTNKLERVNSLVSAIPRLGDLPFDELIGFVDQLFDNIAEGYLGQWTTEVENEIKCDFFCATMNDPACAISFEWMYNYFRDRISGTFTIESALEIVIEFLAEGTFTGTLIIDFMMMFQIQIVRSASSYLGIDAGSLQIAAQVGALVPSSAWELICPSCAPIEGDWSIEVVPGYQTGQIVSQTATTVKFRAQISADNIWRVNAERLSGCSVVTQINQTGGALTYTLKTLCDDTPVNAPVDETDNIKAFDYASNSIFEVIMSWF